MAYGIRAALMAATVITFVGASGALAAPPDQNRDDHNDHKGPPAHTATPNKGPVRGETHQGPTHYSRVNEPSGWNQRPKTFNRTEYQHNFQAARSFKIGPYHRPSGWASRHWSFGQILPRAYWAAPYVIADYWLFALEVPPDGYEWVRDDDDALLVDTRTGEILQVEYGVFA